jgi:hypothetical protein
MEIVWIFIGNRIDFDYHACITELYISIYYGYSIEIVWIYYGFSGAIANFIVRISHLFPSVSLSMSL